MSQAGDAVSRRDLFRLGAVISVGAVVPACHGREGSGEHDAPSGFGPLPAPEIEELSIAELQGKLASGAETSVSLVDKYLRRIAAVNARLRAILDINPEAAAIAARLDAERKAGKLRGPLHGIPIVVKDNIDTGDKMTTTAGSLALEGSYAVKDAFAVARLRDAGAVLLAKANLSEWANIRGSSSAAGWSARGGQCRNPYVLDRTPSGSSSGSAVAAAVSLCAAALGTETDGSVVSPSSLCGLVGIKPTVGLVSRSGVVPIAPSQDTIGPMARSVADAALLLSIIAGPDPADPSTTAPHPNRPRSAEDYTKHLQPRALAGARIGVPRDGFFGINRNIDAIINAAIAKLAELGAVIVDPADLKIPPDLTPAEVEVEYTELKVALAEYLRGRPDARIRSLADAIAFNVQHADREMRFFGQEGFEAGEKTNGLDAPSYIAARAKCLRVARDELLDKVIAEHQLDAFVGATRGPASLIDPVNGDDPGEGCCQLPAIAGYPHITVTAGDYFGVPVGLSFFGAPFSEGKLLGYAFAWEQATKYRHPPRFLATANLG
jgi:amidase